MKCNVVVSPAAREEFKEIHAFVKKQFGKVPAARLKASYQSALKSIRNNPLQFPQVEGIPGLHKCVLRSLTTVYYQVVEQTATVHRVTDGRQQSRTY